LRDATRAELVALLRRFGTTAILVTHDQQEALATADRIGVLERGRLLQVGTPAELYERPANRFVAGFLGAANVLPVTVTGSFADRTLVALGDAAVTVGAGAHPVGACRYLVVRPERMALGERENTLRGVVEQCAYAGAFVTVALRVPDGTLVRVVHPLVEGAAAVPNAGEACAVGWAIKAGLLLAE
jgi:ABC-type Fe3+/spermidine/putrescine transport system ATPase subunit